MTKQLALETSSQNMILPDEGQIRAMNSNTSLDFGTLYSKASRLWHKFPAWIRKPFWAAFLAFTGHEYQRISFRGKTYARGVNRSRSYRQLFLEPPVGKSILDVGCNSGYYSLRASQEGAVYCRSLDLEESNITKLKDVASDLGIHNIDAVQGDIFDYKIERDFDMVLCLNLIHHFDTMERVEKILHKLYQHTVGKFILVALAPEDINTRVSIDTEPDGMGGKCFVRISPLYFVEKYGPENVRFTRAFTYGPNRYVIIISKSK